MEIFKLFESTMADLQPGQNIKHLRRDQLLDNYEASAKNLQILIKAKESEIAYRNDLIGMLEESKSVYNNKLSQVKQDYQIAKSNLPAGIDIKSIGRLDPSILNERSTTPPMPPPASITPTKLKQPDEQASIPILMPQAPPLQSTIPSNNQQMLGPMPVSAYPGTNQSPGPSAIPSLLSNSSTPNHWNSSQTSNRSSDLDLTYPPLPTSQDNHDNRSSLDRRLSEFLKAFPNISQSGLAPPSSIDTTKPPPGYYTPQAPQATPPPPVQAQSPMAAPPAPSTHHHHNQHHHHSRR